MIDPERKHCQALLDPCFHREKAKAMEKRLSQAKKSVAPACGGQGAA
jgi:hypothetical protein